MALPRYVRKLLQIEYQGEMRYLCKFQDCDITKMGEYARRCQGYVCDITCAGRCGRTTPSEHGLICDEYKPSQKRRI